MKSLFAAVLVAVCYGCSSPTPSPAESPAPPDMPRSSPESPSNRGEDGADTEAAAPAPSQGQPCPEGRCQEGFICMGYYGIAGTKGPRFTSCEISCALKQDVCPEGQQCVTIADGPGAVCRPL